MMLPLCSLLLISFVSSSLYTGEFGNIQKSSTAELSNGYFLYAHASRPPELHLSSTADLRGDKGVASTNIVPGTQPWNLFVGRLAHGKLQKSMNPTFHNDKASSEIFLRLKKPLKKMSSDNVSSLCSFKGYLNLLEHVPVYVIMNEFDGMVQSRPTEMFSRHESANSTSGSISDTQLIEAENELNSEECDAPLPPNKSCLPDGSGSDTCNATSTGDGVREKVSRFLKYGNSKLTISKSPNISKSDMAEIIKDYNYEDPVKMISCFFSTLSDAVLFLEDISVKDPAGAQLAKLRIQEIPLSEYLKILYYQYGSSFILDSNNPSLEATKGYRIPTTDCILVPNLTELPKTINESKSQRFSGTPIYMFEPFTGSSRMLQRMRQTSTSTLLLEKYTSGILKLNSHARKLENSKVNFEKLQSEEKRNDSSAYALKIMPSNSCEIFLGTSTTSSKAGSKWLANFFQWRQCKSMNNRFNIKLEAADGRYAMPVFFSRDQALNFWKRIAAAHPGLGLPKNGKLVVWSLEKLVFCDEHPGDIIDFGTNAQKASGSSRDGKLSAFDYTFIAPDRTDGSSCPYVVTDWSYLVGRSGILKRVQLRLLEAVKQLLKRDWPIILGQDYDADELVPM